MTGLSKVNIEPDQPLTSGTEGVKGDNGDRRRWFAVKLPAFGTLAKIFYSMADQGLAVGGGFLANILLARTQTKEDYGIFALTYSAFSFLLGLYYAAILVLLCYKMDTFISISLVLALVMLYVEVDEPPPDVFLAPA